MEWISVKDHMPEESDDNILALFDDGIIEWGGVLDGKFMTETKRRKVTHWLKVPEPPKYDGGIKRGK